MHLGTCIHGCKTYSKCTEKDWGLFAEVRYFQLAELKIPGELDERFLQALVLQEQNEAEKLNQQAKIIRKSSDRKVSMSINWLILEDHYCHIFHMTNFSFHTAMRPQDDF